MPSKRMAQGLLVVCALLVLTVLFAVPRTQVQGYGVPPRSILPSAPYADEGFNNCSWNMRIGGYVCQVALENDMIVRLHKNGKKCDVTVMNVSIPAGAAPGTASVLITKDNKECLQALEENNKLVVGNNFNFNWFKPHWGAQCDPTIQPGTSLAELTQPNSVQSITFEKVRDNIAGQSLLTGALPDPATDVFFEIDTLSMGVNFSQLSGDLLPFSLVSLSEVATEVVPSPGATLTTSLLGFTSGTLDLSTGLLHIPYMAVDMVVPGSTQDQFVLAGSLDGQIDFSLNTFTFDCAMADSLPVGGTTDLLVGNAEPSSSAGGSGSSLPYPAVAGGVAAALALVAGGWYARRRWSRIRLR